MARQSERRRRTESLDFHLAAAATMLIHEVREGRDLWRPVEASHRPVRGRRRRGSPSWRSGAREPEEDHGALEGDE